MINDAAALADCFIGTPLAGRSITTQEIAESSDLLFAVEVDEAELLPVWVAARALVDRTGRWPAVNGFGIVSRPTIDVSTLGVCDPEQGGAEEWGPLAERTFAEVRSAQDQTWDPLPLASRLEFQLACTNARCGSAPEPAEILDRFPSDVPDSELERWLLEWEEQRRPTTEPLNSRHLDWFSGSGSPLTFYPTASGPCSIAYTPFYGETEQSGMPGLTTKRLITILEFWRRAYGAELVANWGTMLEFLVARPPKTLEDAWSLALQQELVAQDTLTLPGITLRDHARTLLERPTWFLHSRP